MSVTIFKDPGFGGVYARLGPGLYSGKDLVGCSHQSANCEELDNEINSLRVDPNIVVAIADSLSMTASGGGARVIMGPADVPDLAALGMARKVSSILVVPYRAYDSAIGFVAADGAVCLYDSYGGTGRRSRLWRGDYPKSRLASEEVRMGGSSIVSMRVEANVLAILYSGENLEPTSDAVLVVGPTLLEDLERLGMAGRVGSIRVLYGDPFDVLGRPALRYGAGRDFIRGGTLGAPHAPRPSPFAGLPPAPFTPPAPLVGPPLPRGHPQPREKKRALHWLRHPAGLWVILLIILVLAGFLYEGAAKARGVSAPPGPPRVLSPPPSPPQTAP